MNQLIPKDSNSVLGSVRFFLFTPSTTAYGVESLASLRFWLVLCCYLASVLIILRDAFFFQEYDFKMQGIIPIILAFLIASDLNWIMLFTGRPGGPNLFLQVLMMAPLSLLISRMIGPYALQKVEDRTVLQHIFNTMHNAVMSLAQSLQAWLPKWLLEMACHPWLALLILTVLLVLCFRSSHVRLSVLGIILLVMLATTIANGLNRPFLLAVLVFILGIALQWNPYGKIAYLCNVHKQLGNQSGDALMFEVIVATMERLFENGEMNGREFEQIVRDRYAPRIEYSREEQRLMMNEIIRRMVEGYHLVSLDVTINGTVMHPLPELYECNRLLANFTVIPRFIAVAFIAVVWTLMPFDAFPDSIPVIGLLDDLAICWISAIVGKDSIQKIKAHHQNR
ncbi:MAG: DUF1232 domain-containing protein [Victivallales bacterium]|nr:DUF1232 domain-containing protein [Victivallales bacterium]